MFMFDVYELVGNKIKKQFRLFSQHQERKLLLWMDQWRSEVCVEEEAAKNSIDGIIFCYF